jgi:hypothetical protein
MTPLQFKDNVDSDDVTSFRKMKWHRAIAQQEGITASQWSIFEVEDFTAVPFPNATEVSYDGRWGSVQTVPIKPNSTWLDLWKAADKAIEGSGDLHHIFIERLTNHNGIVVLQTGS